VTLAQHAPNSNHPGEREPFRFAGFSTPNTTAVPDAFFDEVAPHLTEAELRITLYIIRRTFGFKKAVDAISFSQFLDGITTSDGRVLDRGCGLKSRGHLSKALKSLVAKGVIVAVKSQHRNGANAVSAYALHFAAPVVPHGSGGGSPTEPGVVPEANRQQTEEQQTERQGRFEASKDRPVVDKLVDNRDEPDAIESTVQSPPIVTLIADFSREMGDTKHVGSNITQAHRLFAESAMDLDAFFDVLYEARLRTRKTNGVGNRMAYFFTVLRGLAASSAAP
jgi:hypothetical protein